MADVDGELADVTAEGFGAAVLAQTGIRVAFRSGVDGYNRIATTTSVFSEGSDILLGQPRYDAIPLFTSPNYYGDAMPLGIIGGRTFILDIIVTLNDEVQDITNASFTAQIKANRKATTVLGDFDYEVLDGPTGSLRLTLSPDETHWMASQITQGVWDLEITTNSGDSFTVIPESRVTVRQGVSHLSDEYLYGDNRVNPVRANYAMFTGDTWTRTLTFRTASNGVINKSDCTYEMQLRRLKDDVSPAFSATFDTSSAATGVIKVRLETAGAEQGRYYYDIQETDSDGVISTLRYGVFKFSKDVTHG